MTAATAGAFTTVRAGRPRPVTCHACYPRSGTANGRRTWPRTTPGTAACPTATASGSPASPGGLISDIEKSGLTGRGGAAFPVHRKLAAVLEAADRRRRTPAVIANGAESEPASDKDATLLWLAPHLVLDGLQLAAEALGADTAILVTHADREHDVAGRVRQALKERLNGTAGPGPGPARGGAARFLSG